jgi:hypothetical protein
MRTQANKSAATLDLEFNGNSSMTAHYHSKSEGPSVDHGIGDADGDDMNHSKDSMLQVPPEEETGLSPAMGAEPALHVVLKPDCQ